jgi:hypothetical protein
MAEDIHEQGIGAIRAVKFLPLPVRAKPNSFGGGMYFLETPCPSGIAANSLVGQGVKVPVPAIISTAEDDAGNLSVRAFIQEAMRDCESQVAEA